MRGRSCRPSAIQALRDDLQTLVASWQRVHPNSVWHGEALYWLSRVQEAEGQAEAAAQTRRLAGPMLKDSELPAMRLIARQREAERLR